MAGTFAHLVVADSLSQDANALDSITGLTREMKFALMKFANFCEFGAICPDCPSLMLEDAEGRKWGSLMHHGQTTDVIRCAVPYIAGMDMGSVDAQKCLAWLFGYAAHVVTDLTVHPVLNINIGTFAQNPTLHRQCELHQDVYIFSKLVREDITRVEYLKRCGIASCGSEQDSEKLAPAVARIWKQCLMDAASQSGSGDLPDRPPTPDGWFHRYVTLIDKFVEEGGSIPWLCREFLEGAALVYPEPGDIAARFVQNLKLPSGLMVAYDAVFEQSRTNLKQMWGLLGTTLTSGDPQLFALANADLDTGVDPEGKSAFWA